MRDHLPPIDIAALPFAWRDEIAASLSAAEAALRAAERAAAAGHVESADKAIGRHISRLFGLANLFAIAGARCGGAEPGRAAAAALNVPFEFEPLTIAAGFGSIWATEHDGTRVARVDPVTGDVLATIAVGREPVKLQAADGRMWGRTADAFFAIDPTTNVVTASLAKAEVGPDADRAWAVDGGLWVCDGERLHHYDTATPRRVATIDLGVACDMPGGTSDLIVASSLNLDDGESGASVASFVDPATDQLLATVDLPADLNIGVVLDDAVFFAAERGSQAVVVDRATWTVAATPDLGRATGDIGTMVTNGTSIYVPTLDNRDVLVVDAATFAVTETVKPLGAHSVALLDDSLWVSSVDYLLQRFDLSW